MQTTILRAFVYSLAISSCLADVTWTPIGCDGWDFQGKDINAIWNNAVELATQSQSQIDLIPKKFSLTGFSGEENRAGANGEMVFGADFTKHRGLSDGGKVIMEQARSRYDEVLSGFAGKLPDLNTKWAFMLCGANGFREAPIPGAEFPVRVWHAEVNIEGITEYITLSHVTPGSPEPCQEPIAGGQYYQAKTVYAELNRGDNRGEKLERLTGIILCPNKFEEAGIPVKATLDRGYQTQGKKGNKPYHTDYNSLSGSLLHEMVHVVARFKYNTKWEDDDRKGNVFYGFKAVHDLARSNPTRNLMNPDTFKIFAEMSQSPATEWGMTYIPSDR